MTKFTLEVEIETKADGGDTVVSGTAKATIDDERRTYTAGARLTAAQKRGGKTESACAQEVACSLAKMACKAAFD